MNCSHFVGLGVGRKTFDASLVSADEKELSHKSSDNTPTGVQFLLNWVIGHHLFPSKLLFYTENMGSYATELSVSNISVEFFLALVYPLTVKKFIGLQRGKNDRISAKRIANYAALHYRKLELYKLPDKDLVRLRGWTIMHGNLAKQKVSNIELSEAFSWIAKLVDMIESISFLEEQPKSIKERILEVEEDMEQLITTSTPLYTNYLLLRSMKGAEIVNVIVLLCVTGNS